MAENTGSRKQAVRAIFSRAAPTYGGIGPPFTHFGRRLVEVAGLQLGWKVLDVAAGRGAVTFPAVEQVGMAGHVLGIDLAPQMVIETLADLKQRGLKNVDLREMDAEQLELADESFDAVLCGFGLMFFPELGRALGEFRRVLRAGSVIAVTTWDEGDPRWTWYDELVRSYSQTDNVPPRARQLTRPSELAGALESAGFADVSVAMEAQDVVFPTEESWWSSLWSHGMRGALDRMPPPVLSDFKDAAFAKMQPQRESDGFHEVWQALIGTGRRPQR